MVERLKLSAAVGQRVRELRIASGIPLQRLASQAGMRQAELLGLEQGRVHPPLEAIGRLARGLHVSVLDLVNAARTPRAPQPVPVAAKPVSRMNLDSIAAAITELPESMGDKLEVVEHAAVKHAMQVCGSNQTAAARLLGIERKALTRRWDKVKKLTVKGRR